MVSDEALDPFCPHCLPRVPGFDCRGGRPWWGDPGSLARLLGVYLNLDPHQSTHQYLYHFPLIRHSAFRANFYTFKSLSLEYGLFIMLLVSGVQKSDLDICIYAYVFIYRFFSIIDRY